MLGKTTESAGRRRRRMVLLFLHIRSVSRDASLLKAYAHLNFAVNLVYGRRWLRLQGQGQGPGQSPMAGQPKQAPYRRWSSSYLSLCQLSSRVSALPYHLVCSGIVASQLHDSSCVAIDCLSPH